MHLPRAENVGCFLSGKLEFSLVLVALETPSTTYKMADRHQRFQETTSYNLGQNKMEQQTPVPPKSRMKPREGQKRAIFPSLIWEGGRGGSRFSIYVVQDCSFLMGYIAIGIGIGIGIGI